ncbi:hypothetical protein JCM10908_003381 [Rhodotorula pacifica]|uniref:uncharacterized protein n=1 Tax=Rhodotorula pacifica TaxID=1495444 RepID=UPI00316CC4F6
MLSVPSEHQKLVWPGHKLVCGPDKARPFRLPDYSQKNLKVLATLAHKRHLPYLNGYLRAVQTSDGQPAPLAACVLIYHVACKEKVEMQFGPTPYIATLQRRLKASTPAVSSDALDLFSHRAVILWELLKTMYRQEQAEAPTADKGDEVITVDHIHVAVRLMQGGIMQQLLESDFISMITFPQAIFDPFNSIRELRRHKAILSVCGMKGLVHDFRVLDSDEGTDDEDEDGEGDTELVKGVRALMKMGRR